jgi:hypothetical protein
MPRRSRKFNGGGGPWLVGSVPLDGLQSVASRRMPEALHSLQIVASLEMMRTRALDEFHAMETVANAWTVQEVQWRRRPWLVETVPLDGLQSVASRSMPRGVPRSPNRQRAWR